jgi:hypothetical protein
MSNNNIPNDRNGRLSGGGQPTGKRHSLLVRLVEKTIETSGVEVIDPGDVDSAAGIIQSLCEKLRLRDESPDGFIDGAGI